MKNLVDSWDEFKRDQPTLALALSVLPVTGQIAAATEYYGAVSRGDTAGGIEAALNFIPGLSMARKGKAIYKAGETAMKVARNTETTANVYSAAKAAGQAAQRAGLGLGAVGAAGEVAANYGNVKDYYNAETQ